MTPMRVIEVSTCPHTSRPMVMLQVEGRDRWLAFYIPMNEANRLARCLGMTQCPCTPIFELTEQLIGHLQAEVRRAHLEGDERGISAGLVLERDGLEMTIPCHPADAVALAVRAGKPIMAHDSALAHARSAPLSSQPDGASEPPPTALDAVQAWLDQVRPADFGDGPPR
jgi:bifunctional DNase/RNase